MAPISASMRAMAGLIAAASATSNWAACALNPASPENANTLVDFRDGPAVEDDARAVFRQAARQCKADALPRSGDKGKPAIQREKGPGRAPLARLYSLWRKLRTRSKSTAKMIAPPIKAPCQNALMPSRPRLLRMISIRAAPINAPNAVPMPPANGAADDCRRNDLQFQSRADIGGDGSEPACLDDTGYACRQAPRSYRPQP